MLRQNPDPVSEGYGKASANVFTGYLKQSTLLVPPIFTISFFPKRLWAITRFRRSKL